MVTDLFIADKHTNRLEFQANDWFVFYGGNIGLQYSKNTHEINNISTAATYDVAVLKCFFLYHIKMITSEPKSCNVVILKQRID